MFPKSTHETFATKLFQSYRNNKRFSKPKLARTDFTIGHYAGDVIFIPNLHYLCAENLESKPKFWVCNCLTSHVQWFCPYTLWSSFGLLEFPFPYFTCSVVSNYVFLVVVVCFYFFFCVYIFWQFWSSYFPFTFQLFQFLICMEGSQKQSSVLLMSSDMFVICLWNACVCTALLFQVTYQTELFLDKNKDYVVAEHQALLGSSKCSFVASLFPRSGDENSKSSYRFSSIGNRFKVCSSES